MKYPLYTVEFWDHVTCTGYRQASLQKCIVTGALVNQTKNAIILCTWVSGKIKDDNSDYAVIHKGTIIRKRRAK